MSFRVIDDLSRPEGRAVNDDIRKEDFPVRFSTFLDTIKIIRENKGKIWMWQRDLKDAYRQILMNTTEAKAQKDATIFDTLLEEL